MKKVLDRLDKPARIALGAGVAAVALAIFLPTILALLLGLVASAVLGFAYPKDPVKMAVLVALPILAVAFLMGFVRGFSTLVLLVILVPSLIAPVWLARQGAELRVGRADDKRV